MAEVMEWVVVDEQCHRYKVVPNKLEAIKWKWIWANQNYDMGEITNLPKIFERRIIHQQKVGTYEQIMDTLMHKLFPRTSIIGKAFMK